MRLSFHLCYELPVLHLTGAFIVVVQHAPGMGEAGSVLLRKDIPTVIMAEARFCEASVGRLCLCSSS